MVMKRSIWSKPMPPLFLDTSLGHDDFKSVIDLRAVVPCIGESTPVRIPCRPDLTRFKLWGVAQGCNCRSILDAIAMLIEAQRPDLAMVLIEQELNSQT